MIGVIPRLDQVEVVAEFFELFKTPWEPYDPRRKYNVIIATAEEIPEVQTKLLLVFGRAVKAIDARMGVVSSRLSERAILEDRHTLLPIYGGLLLFASSGPGSPCLTCDRETAGLRISAADSAVIRLGYDLFDELQLLLSNGQPIEYAHIPTLDIHIGMLRQWIVDAGIPLLEIPPVPAGHSFMVCLTHDIDFVGIRNHKFDHSMWGFIYRATVGALYNFVRGRLSLARLCRNWFAAASLPLVYAGWARDFWEPFEWYLRVEKGIPATYFLIPFKRRAGENVAGRRAPRRAAAYDVSDLANWTGVLLREGCELGVHGIDAWHSADKGRDELARIVEVAGRSRVGIRMHWLLRRADTPSLLEEAGYAYDSTFGYNETVGYRAGTAQAYRVKGVQKLLELPLHIQDGALFYRNRLDLTEPDAESRCQTMIDNARRFGGALTLLWHDRSHGPERLWGDFYIRLVQKLKSLNVWFGTASQAVDWFTKRRAVRFSRIEGTGGDMINITYDGEEIHPPLNLRSYKGVLLSRDSELSMNPLVDFVDIPWNGSSSNPPDLHETFTLSGMRTEAPSYSA